MQALQLINLLKIPTITTTTMTALLRITMGKISQVIIAF